MKLAFAVVAALAVPSIAEADCARPLWIGTPAGTAIPPHGSLYINDGGFDVKLPFPATRISQDVVRMDYHLEAPIMFELDWQTTMFVPDFAWTAPTAAPKALHYWHEITEGSCSHADAWWIQVDQPTAAFRVRWTQNGSTDEFIEPAQTGDDGRAALALGKRYCIGGENISVESLQEGGRLELTAIRFDGSEVRVEGLPSFLRTDMLLTSEQGIGGAVGYAIAAPVLDEAPPVSTNAASGHAFLLIAASGVGLVFVGLLILGRPRTPHPVRM